MFEDGVKNVDLLRRSELHLHSVCSFAVKRGADLLACGLLYGGKVHALNVLDIGEANGDVRALGKVQHDAVPAQILDQAIEVLCLRGLVTRRNVVVVPANRCRSDANRQHRLITFDEVK